MTKQVLSVGQCGADHGSISHWLKSNFGADVQASRSLNDAVEKAKSGSFDLILVNRILDADGSPGVHVIQSLKQDDRTSQIPVMLVSNYADAQQAAVEAGAIMGFGKSELHKSETVQKVSDVIG